MKEFLLLFPFFQSVLTYQMLNYSVDSVNSLQQNNMHILVQTLQLGWREFCASPVDEGVMSLLADINPNEAVIYAMTMNNQSAEVPIKAISQLRHFNINFKRPTLIFVNAFYTPNSLFSIQAHLKLLQRTRTDLNIIVVDFTRDLSQLYFSVKYNTPTQAYFVAQLVAELLRNGLQHQDITLAGFSIGANIAALAADILYEDLMHVKLGRLIALDPAVMCDNSDIYVKPTVCTQVIVIHGESVNFGYRNGLGTIDIYPNGVGFKGAESLQPGCKVPFCNHLYPFLLFMEALVEGVITPAQKCENWIKYMENQCSKNKTLQIGLNYANETGVYFSNTNADPPFIAL